MASVGYESGFRVRASGVSAAMAVAAAAASLLVSGAAFAQQAPAAAATVAPSAGNAQRGSQLAYTCYGCHGIPDYRNAYPTYHVPKLGGQHAAYIVASLTEYRNGARPHPTMRGQAMAMTDQEIRDVAAYFATQNPVKSDGNATGTAPAAAQTCVACHGTDGVGILPEYPTLSGQHRDYLEHSLRAYRRGERQNAIMQGFAQTLTDEDIAALAAYFARQTPALWTPQPPRAPEMRAKSSPVR